MACEFISPFADMTQESRSPSPSLFRPQSCFNTTGKYVFPIFIPACMTEYMLYYDSSWDTVTGRHTASVSPRDAVRPIRLLVTFVPYFARADAWVAREDSALVEDICPALPSTHDHATYSSSFGLQGHASKTLNSQTVYV